ncbi:MAG: PAS domain S-box protein [bacterium]|nr:PAS domain S-box protein [bacterium]
MSDSDSSEDLRGRIKELEDKSARLIKLEEARREGERRLATLMDNLPGIVYRCRNDRDYTMEFISDGCREVTGYSPEELVDNASLSFNDLIHADDQSMVWEQIQQAVVDQRNYTLTYRINCRDGQEKWVWEQGVGVFDDSGRLLALEGFISNITDQKNNEDALRREMEFIDTLLQAAPVFFVALDYDGRVLMMNQAMLKTLEYRAEEVIGTDYVQSYVPQVERAGLSDLFKTLTKPGGVTLNRSHLQSRSGNQLLVEWHGRTVTDSEGKFRFFFGVGSDVSEREKAELELRKRESELSAIFRAAPTGIGLVVNRVIHEANARLCDMTGYTKKELIGQNGRMLYPDDSEYDFVGEQKYRQIREKGTGTVETRWKRKNGEIVDILLSSTPINPDDLEEGVTFTALDITERRKSQEALRSSEERYRQLIETMNDGLATADADGRLTFVNKRLCDMLGYETGELTGRETSDFFDADNQKILEDQQVRRKTGVQAIYEIAWTKKDGSQISTIMSPGAVLDDAGEYQGSFAVITDITERKRLEEQFQHSQRIETVGRLAAGIAHDFNNMLSPILCYTELVLEDLLPADSHRAQVVEIQKAAERARDLTQRLLAFSRKQVLELKPVNLSDKVMDFEKMLRGTLREDIELRFFLDPDAGNIRGDVSQIEQILMNLAVNAQHAMPKEGSLSIEVVQVEVDKVLTDQQTDLTPGKYLQLSVSDTGVGMDEETVQHVFEPFFTTRPTGKGTGLGLATVYGIVKQHGGQISVRSQEGKGTEFRIYFPLTSEPLEIPKARSSLRDSAVCNETVMVAEDEQMLRDLVCTVLGGQGYTVISAASGQDCLQVVEDNEGPVHLLLTDVIMPGLNGKELYDRMSALVPNLKVLYFSGYAADIIADHGVLDEGISFLKKPFSVASLVSKVREVLDA